MTVKTQYLVAVRYGGMRAILKAQPTEYYFAQQLAERAITTHSFKHLQIGKGIRPVVEILRIVRTFK